ncbi:MAG TPA: hypothetical protein PLO37_14360 [Candidatus Hydrogenedentes bacterium]|nr:hypothetical protein [Candidatus Hydrogenedentota bacterium]HPG68029.1 hypothetical protein [Candidatus Hydrogenedentota bacterium]
MSRFGYLLLALGMVAASAAFADIDLSSPGFPASTVDANGALHEPWGVFSLRVGAPEGDLKIDQRQEQAPFPKAVTVKSVGPITLTETAFRAPVWPSGIDVLTAAVANDSDTPQTVRLDVVVPADMGVGERTGAAKGRTVLALPANTEPQREEHDWGCTGGVSALPGWGHPNQPCDPAFSNISAGMGGVPIKYRFAVPPGEARTVVLGFCESHWTTAGQRPVEILVEGAPKSQVDPIAQWGHNVPGCLEFSARDENADGKIDVAIAPHPKASDRNTILNVAWVFPANVPIDLDRVVAGECSKEAECYVDVGGPNDQMLYKPGALSYTLTIEPKSEQTLLFLLESPGGSGVPDPAHTAWTLDSLREAAADVWKDYDPARWQ